MKNQPPLQERIILMINEAERLSAMLNDLKKPETAMAAYSFLPDWDEAVRQAIHLCRLACIVLSHDELDDLRDRVNALDEGKNLWEHYVLAEWYDNWHGFDGSEGDFLK